MKNCILLFLSLLLFSCSKDTEFIQEENIALTAIDSENLPGISAKKITSAPVKLEKSWSSYSNYRGFETYTRNFTVRVQNIGFMKEVAIYHQKLDGSWITLPMYFEKSILDGAQELWTFEYRHTGDRILGDVFVVRYAVNGQTYWDNNASENYVLGRNEGTYFGNNQKAGIDQNFVSLFPVFRNNHLQFNVVADVQNISPEKEVIVLFSTDNWVTSYEAPLRFERFWYSGYQYVLESPNSNNIERWTTSIDLPNKVQQVEYVLKYIVNGTTFWDNNYGENFTVFKD